MGRWAHSGPAGARLGAGGVGRGAHRSSAGAVPGAGGMGRGAHSGPAGAGLGPGDALSVWTVGRRRIRMSFLPGGLAVTGPNWADILGRRDIIPLCPFPKVLQPVRKTVMVPTST